MVAPVVYARLHAMRSFEFQDWRAAKDQNERRFFSSLFWRLARACRFCSVLIMGQRATVRSCERECADDGHCVRGVLPGALLIYFALKHNFLEYGAQRNLVYALSATFLALLYLAFVRRVSGWLEPVLPPEATASILLFVLIFLFEPLERVIGPALHRRFQERVGRLQQLSTELADRRRGMEILRIWSRLRSGGFERSLDWAWCGFRCRAMRRWRRWNLRVVWGMWRDCR